MVEAEKIAKAIYIGEITSNVYRLLVGVILDIIIIIIVLFFISKGLPWYWGVMIVVFSIVLNILQIIKIKRISTALTSPSPNLPAPAIQIIPGEKIIDFVAGVTATGFTGRGFGWLGKGEMAFPQNAIIITNKRIAFITVPVLGAEKIVGSTVVGIWQYLLAKKDIENKLKEMMASQPLEKILQGHPKNFSIRFEEIKKIKMNSFQLKITFITKDNKKYSYSTRDKKDFERAKEIFRNFL